MPDVAGALVPVAADLIYRDLRKIRHLEPSRSHTIRTHSSMPHARARKASSEKLSETSWLVRIRSLVSPAALGRRQRGCFKHHRDATQTKASGPPRFTAWRVLLPLPGAVPFCAVHSQSTGR